MDLWDQGTMASEKRKTCNNLTTGRDENFGSLETRCVFATIKKKDLERKRDQRIVYLF